MLELRLQPIEKDSFSLVDAAANHPGEAIDFLDEQQLGIFQVLADLRV
jgi:hypothetical protein